MKKLMEQVVRNVESGDLKEALNGLEKCFENDFLCDNQIIVNEVKQRKMKWFISIACAIVRKMTANPEAALINNLFKLMKSFDVRPDVDMTGSNWVRFNFACTLHVLPVEQTLMGSFRLPS
ncbi:unnamed protein product [Soboliphyme baturini]|uniref:TERF2 n=1 Tax=Soboliphyme baturini TaxID=241478 RepID=A0A183IZ00_9BILA|nr:unnamed protein product [Soboliphyme baturini]